MFPRIVAYMTSWCPDCVRARRVLQRSGIPFREIDTDEVEGAEAEMRALNGGSGKVPTIVIETERTKTVLVEPGDRELGAALKAAKQEDQG